MAAVFVGPVADRLAIRELVDAYGDAVCRRDVLAWLATWSPDGVWRIRGQCYQGHAQLRTTWLAAMAAYRFVAFSGYPGSVVVDGARASLRVQTTEYLAPLSGPARLQHGCYEDRLERIGERWCFAERSFTVLSQQSFGP